MTKIVIVDKNDKVIGATEKINAVQKGLIRRVSRVILYKSDGKFLMQQRSKNKKLNPLKWDFSAAGHVDEGEDYEDAAKREICEELGLKNIKLSKVDYFFIEDEPMRGINIKLPKFNTIFIGKYKGGKINTDDVEVEKVKWMTYAEIKKMFNQSPDNFTTAFGVTFKRLEDKLVMLI